MFSKTKRRSGLLHDTPDGSKDASPSLISPSMWIVGNLRSRGRFKLTGQWMAMSWRTL